MIIENHDVCSATFLFSFRKKVENLYLLKVYVSGYVILVLSSVFMDLETETNLSKSTIKVEIMSAVLCFHHYHIFIVRAVYLKHIYCLIQYVLTGLVASQFSI